MLFIGGYGIYQHAFNVSALKNGYGSGATDGFFLLT